ncbi:hypothetical protein SEA_LAILA_1 [Arthrobacter phage Laila]|nr:hypothetical protein SEA_ELKHORN_1 [Arthrobacter phage Elkhorn]ASR83683.1 hypothetical protein SEA_LORE_1 [Arthrobacter phage Lore]QBP30087.1 hypothetical protein SEA_BLAIR_1 [Arthrobacter phage Blair]QBP30773.1 hypothetical protein SEA_STEWIEGRIFF_1 [Arthrobacter phage StewieGriff]QDB74325.1 hypothetical protein SEA_LAILA_1 [Arthrobacter phage Laila]
MTEYAPMLPGFEAPKTGMSKLEQRCSQHLVMLQDLGLLKDHDQVMAQLVMDLAHAVALSSAAGKAAGTALAVKPLMEALDKLPKPATEDAFAAMMKEAGLV